MVMVSHCFGSTNKRFQMLDCHQCNPSKCRSFLNFRHRCKLEGTLTAINGLEQDQPTARIKDAVYNLQGQKVASNATEIDSLPAGIYIVNNKKIFIK